MDLTVIGPVSIDRVAAGTYDLTLAQIILGIDIGSAPDARDIIIMGMSANVPTALVDINFEKISDAILRFFINVNGTPYDNSFSFSLYKMSGQSRSAVVVGPPLPVPPIPSSTTLQQAYNNSVGIPVLIAESVVNGGIRILGTPGIGSPVLELNNGTSSEDTLQITRLGGIGGNGIDISMPAVAAGNGIRIALAAAGVVVGLLIANDGVARSIDITNSVGGANVINITHSGGAGNSIAISRSPAVVTGGNGLSLVFGTNTTGNPVNISESGSGRPIQITHTAGANSSIRLDRAPAVVTAGAGLDIIYGANTTGNPIIISNAGTGGGVVITNTGSGVTLSINSTGAGQVAAWSHSGTNATPFSFSNSSNTAGISTVWTRLPTVATGGTIFRINSNGSFTGINLEIIQSAVGGSDQGIELVTRGSGIGMRIHDQAGSLHTGTALRLQHDITGSTGLLLEMLKSPAAATAGDAASITMGANTTGNIWTVAHAGTGLYESVSITGTGGGISISESGGPGAGVQLSLLRTSTSTALMAGIARSPTAVATGENLRITAGANATGHGIRMIGGALAGMTMQTIALQAAGVGLRIVEDIPGAANTGVALEILRILNGSTGILLSLSKTPGAGAATGGNIITFTMGGVGATTGDVIGGTGTATNAGRFITLSWLGTGEIWRVTGAAGTILSTMNVSGRLGLGNFVPASPSRISFKEHAAFAGSEAQHTTGSGSTVGAVTADLITLALTDNTTYILEALIVGRDAGGVEKAAYTVFAGVFRQAAGVATFISGTSPNNIFTSESIAAANATFVLVGNNAIVRATGTAGLTWAWVCMLRWQAVSTSA